jgi:hypothetical protein
MHSSAQRIFFDTEFTGLTPDAKLISIGLVDEPGRNEFYAELCDTYVANECSEFCKQEVLRHLEGGAVQMTLAELQVALAAWLRARGPGVVLVCDSPRDIGQLNTVLPHGLPANVTIQVLGGWGNLKRRVFNAGRRIHQQHGYRVHHALDDAKVNRLVLMR